MANSIIPFLQDLALNNNKAWFDANRPRYEHAKAELFDVVRGVVDGLAPFDPSIAGMDAKKCVFRQNRDVRFSKNKDPYKINMGAFIAKGGKNAGNAGYYMHFEPGASFIGGGVYAPQPPELKAIRNEIYFHAETFRQIISDASFVETFGEMMDEKLVNVPKGFPADFPEAELLKYKHYVVSRPFSPEFMSVDEVVSLALQTFKMMTVFNLFLNQAILNAE